MSRAIAAYRIPVTDGIPVAYGKTIDGNVQPVSNIEEVLGDEGPESHAGLEDGPDGG